MIHEKPFGNPAKRMTQMESNTAVQFENLDYGCIVCTGVPQTLSLLDFIDCIIKTRINVTPARTVGR